jgi:hypothetical protein
MRSLPIADCQLPIADSCEGRGARQIGSSKAPLECRRLKIGNWQLAIGNDGRTSDAQTAARLGTVLEEGSWKICLRMFGTD